MDNTGATVVPPGVLTDEGSSGPFCGKPGLVGGITGKRGGGGVELGNCPFPRVLVNYFNYCDAQKTKVGDCK
jgi:hypothetical protein